MAILHASSSGHPHCLLMLVLCGWDMSLINHPTGGHARLPYQQGWSAVPQEETYTVAHQYTPPHALTLDSYTWGRL